MTSTDLQQSVARHYDEVDPFYRALWGEHLHHGLWERGDESPEDAAVALVLRVAEAAGVAGRTGTSVVDIGCGYGATARLLNDRFGARVTGITVSPVQHAHATAAAAGSPDLSFRLGDWGENRLPAASFDAAIAIESTEHMADKPAVFAEAARVLVPGGRLVVCAWLASPGATRMQRRHLLEPIVMEGRLASLDTAASYTEWLRAAGFQGVEITDLSRHVARTWTICARRMLAQLRTRAAWRYLLDGRNTERVFARTVLRMAAGYGTGCLRYGIMTASRE